MTIHSRFIYVSLDADGFFDNKSNRIKGGEIGIDSTWESLVDTLYQMTDAQALGN